MTETEEVAQARTAAAVTAASRLNQFAAEQAAELAEGDDSNGEWALLRDKPRPPALGWRRAGAGRAPIVQKLKRWMGSSNNTAFLYPFVIGAGAPALGVPIGPHMLTNEPVAIDAGEWLRAGLITNTGIYVTGQPGVGKSTFLRRLSWGMSAFGTGVLFPADLKNEHGALVRMLGGEHIEVGIGMHKINLLDAGPLKAVLHQVDAATRDRLEREIQSRALWLAEGAMQIADQGQRLSPTDKLAFTVAYELFRDRNKQAVDPTMPDLLRILRELPSEVAHALLVDAADKKELRDLIRPVTVRIELLLRGELAGLFDGPSTFSLGPEIPAMSLDLSRIENQGSDAAVAIAMLASWGWSAALIDAGQTTGKRRNWLQNFDEHWRVMRAGPGMVELSDRVTRLNRHRGVQSTMATHSLDDFEALPTAEDRAKARGMVSRCAVKVIAAQPREELEKLSAISPLSNQEQDWVESWAAPPTWTPGQQHPGRGRYLIKTGRRIGLPVQMTLLPEERSINDTDQAWHVTDEPVSR